MSQRGIIQSSSSRSSPMATLASAVPIDQVEHQTMISGSKCKMFSGM